MPHGANRLLLWLALALLCSSCYPQLPADPLSTDDADSAGGDLSHHALRRRGRFLEPEALGVVFCVVFFW